MSGTVNVSRSLWDDTTFKDSEMSQREAWIWLIAEASWKERVKRFGSVEIKTERGQVAVSTRFMARAWMWSEARVRRYLDMLENRRMVCRKIDAGVTVITICKYDEYQNGPPKSDAAATQQSTQQRRTADANEKKGERRVKEGKKEYGGVSGEKEPDLLSTEDAPKVDPLEDTLEKLYAIFPKRRDGKYSTPAAIRPALKTALKKISISELLRCAENYAASGNHKDGEFARKAVNWLKDEEWQNYASVHVQEEQLTPQQQRWREIAARHEAEKERERGGRE